MPYLVRVLLPENFGVVIFAQSLMACFVVFVNYGFDWSATRKIAVSRTDPRTVSRIAANVWASKALLCLAGLVLLIVLMHLLPDLNRISRLLLVLYGIPVGNLLFPSWLFLGMERMALIAVINFIMRLLTTAGVFLFLRSPEDYMLYALLLSFQWVGAGATGAIVGYKACGLMFVFPSWKEVAQVLGEGWTLFLSTGAISLYTAGNAFILGLLTDASTVGYYGAAEKLVSAGRGLLSPLTQAVYPRFSKLAGESKAKALFWARKVLFLMTGVGLALSTAFFLGAPIVVRVILGPDYGPSVNVLRILAVLPTMVAISNVLGIQIMVPFRYERPFLGFLVLAGLINLVLALLLAPAWKAPGMAVAVAISESFVTLAFFLYSWAIGLNPLRRSLGS